MKTLSALAIILSFSISAIAARSEIKSLYCSGGAYHFSVRYELAIAKLPKISAYLLLNGQTLATDFISDAHSTPSRVDENGHILEYGSVISPTRFAAFKGNEIYQIRMQGDWTQAALLTEGGRQLTTLSCRVYNY